MTKQPLLTGEVASPFPSPKNQILRLNVMDSCRGRDHRHVGQIAQTYLPLSVSVYEFYVKDR